MANNITLYNNFKDLAYHLTRFAEGKTYAQCSVVAIEKELSKVISGIPDKDLSYPHYNASDSLHTFEEICYKDLPIAILKFNKVSKSNTPYEYVWKSVEIVPYKNKVKDAKGTIDLIDDLLKLDKIDDTDDQPNWEDLMANWY